jgi:hypothetical protein
VFAEIAELDHPIGRVRTFDYRHLRLLTKVLTGGPLKWKRHSKMQAL